MHFEQISIGYSDVTDFCVISPNHCRDNDKGNLGVRNLDI